MTYEDFICNIWENVRKCPKEWRLGQKVFNVCEDMHGNIARDVQFLDNIDCFYNDEKINDFIDAVWRRVKNGNN